MLVTHNYPLFVRVLIVQHARLRYNTPEYVAAFRGNTLEKLYCGRLTILLARALNVPGSDNTRAPRAPAHTRPRARKGCLVAPVATEKTNTIGAGLA
jgi:hypothetical protein